MNNINLNLLNPMSVEVGRREPPGSRTHQIFDNVRLALGYRDTIKSTDISQANDRKAKGSSKKSHSREQS